MCVCVDVVVGVAIGARARAWVLWVVVAVWVCLHGCGFVIP